MALLCLPVVTVTEGDAIVRFGESERDTIVVRGENLLSILGAG